MDNLEILRSVINNGLCNRCGTCVGLSGGKVFFTDKENVVYAIGLFAVSRYLTQLVISAIHLSLKIKFAHIIIEILLPLKIQSFLFSSI